MSCDEANAYIEAAAVGEPVPDEATAHIAGCRTCAARLALARRVDLTLQLRPVPSPPAHFTLAVMRRLRDQRWQAERVVDLGFNVAMIAGALILVIGLAGLAWRLGMFHVNDDVLRFAASTATLAARRIATDMRVVLAGMLFVTTAVGLWWWAEDAL